MLVRLALLLLAATCAFDIVLDKILSFASNRGGNESCDEDDVDIAFNAFIASSDRIVESNGCLPSGEEVVTLTLTMPSLSIDNPIDVNDELVSVFASTR